MKLVRKQFCGIAGAPICGLTLTVAAAAQTVTSIDYPGAAGTIPGFDPTGSTATEPWCVNTAGAIVGYWVDTSSVVHGFLRP